MCVNVLTNVTKLHLIVKCYQYISHATMQSSKLIAYCSLDLQIFYLWWWNRIQLLLMSPSEQRKQYIISRPLACNIHLKHFHRLCRRGSAGPAVNNAGLQLKQLMTRLKENKSSQGRKTCYINQGVGSQKTVDSDTSLRFILEWRTILLG